MSRVERPRAPGARWSPGGARAGHRFGTRAHRVLAGLLVAALLARALLPTLPDL